MEGESMITWEDLGKAIAMLDDKQKQMTIAVMDLNSKCFYDGLDLYITEGEEDLLGPGVPLISVDLDMDSVEAGSTVYEFDPHWDQNEEPWDKEDEYSVEELLEMHQYRTNGMNSCLPLE